MKVELNGRDVTGAFTSATGMQRRGLVNGLTVGRNTIMAQADGARAAELVVANAPRGGPVLSGTQLLPYATASAARSNRMCASTCGEPRGSRDRPTRHDDAGSLMTFLCGGFPDMDPLDRSASRSP